MTIGEVTVLTANGPIKEMPTAILADEILMEGEGQIKALICVGGNPLLAWPGQEKSFKALKNLDLLVVLDYKVSATAELADYVIGSKLCLERDDLTVLTDIWYEQPYSMASLSALVSRLPQNAYRSSPFGLASLVPISRR